MRKTWAWDGEVSGAWRVCIVWAWACFMVGVGRLSLEMEGRDPYDLVVVAFCIPSEAPSFLSSLSKMPYMPCMPVLAACLAFASSILGTHVLSI